MRRIERLLQLQEMDGDARQAEIDAINEKSRARFAVVVSGLRRYDWTNFSWEATEYYSIPLGEYKSPTQHERSRTSYQLIAVPYECIDDRRIYTGQQIHAIGVEILKVASNTRDRPYRADDISIAGHKNAALPSGHNYSTGFDALYENAVKFDELLSELLEVRPVGIADMLTEAVVSS